MRFANFLIRCFWINLPAGAVVIAFVTVCMPRDLGRATLKPEKMGWWQNFRRLNPVGSTIFIVSVSCLVLALQWSGSSGNWREPRTIATLTAFAVSMVGWVVLQYTQGDDAIVPWRVAKQRTVAGASLYTFFGQVAFTVVIYWLAMW